MPPVIPTITIGSGLGAAIFVLKAEKSGRILLGLEAFVALWLTQFVVWGFWYMFIYPFFISPLRKLPTPGKWRFGTGHAVQAIGKGIGVSAREW